MEVANEKLGSLNNISEGNYFKMSVELRQSTRTLVSMKRELDSVFRRIRLVIVVLLVYWQCSILVVFYSFCYYTGSVL